jgi:hypothetical protein
MLWTDQTGCLVCIKEVIVTLYCVCVCVCVYVCTLIENYRSSSVTAYIVKEKTVSYSFENL